MVNNDFLEIKSYSKEDFFKAIIFFQNATYNQKIEYMNKNWGNIKSTTTIHYPVGCSVTIGLDNSNKYFFEFDCKNISFDEFQEKLPMYSASIVNLEEEEIKQKHPEIKALEIKKEDISENFANEPEIQNTISLDDAYLNYYRGINLKK